MIANRIRRVRRRRVAVLQKSVPQYRRRFFELLRDELDDNYIDLDLIYGQPGQVDDMKGDRIDFPGGTRIENRIIKVGRTELYWQPCLQQLVDVDLVIVEQAARLLVNYVLQFQHILGTRRVAFWGHGRNFQAETAHPLAEAVKRLVSRHAHWWFAYNEMSAAAVRALGFPDERITPVQNSIDTRTLRRERAQLSEADVARVRRELGLTGDHVCLYIGAMYPEKRLPFLLECCRDIKRKLPDFQMVFIGAGPDASLVQEAAASHAWIRYVGPKFGSEKIPYLAVSKLLLMPGLVGLAVLDAFALEVPLVTTEQRIHSPEIEYLQPGRNGVLTPFNRDAYVTAVVQLLQSPLSLSRLQAGCREAAAIYTIEAMAARFSAGICRAIDAV